jgi:pimeloyl-ACP methyl ester carboxylesterase
MHHNSVLRFAGNCLSAALLLTIATSGNTFAQNGQGQNGQGQNGQSSKPPLVIAEQGNFWVGGQYNDRREMVGPMYVEYQIPKDRKHKYPIVFVHGCVGAHFWSTPDRREGWAPYFLRQGYAVYVTEYVSHGRSSGNTDLGPAANAPNQLTVQRLWSTPEKFNVWPAASLHTQWVGSGEPGDPTFDEFMRSFSWSNSMPNPVSSQFDSDRLVALIDQIGPVIFIGHSAASWRVWPTLDRRPDKVKAYVNIEGGWVYKNAPPLGNNLSVLPWGLAWIPLTYSPAVSNASELQWEEVPVTGIYPWPGAPQTCWRQKEPARKLPNLARVPIFMPLSQAGYDTTWDPCVHEFLTQAGVAHTFLPLTNLGIYGNGHFMFIEKNSDQVAGVVLEWLRRTVKDTVED